jgi:hypothetical protein
MLFVNTQRLIQGNSIPSELFRSGGLHTGNVVGGDKSFFVVDGRFLGLWII